MKKKSPKSLRKTKKTYAFEIIQALVGLEMGKTDKKVLNYLDFFSKKIPISAAYFVHVLPNLSVLNTLSNNNAFPIIREYSVREDLKKKLVEKVKKRFLNIKGIDAKYQISEGNPLDTMLKISCDLKTDLVVIGQNSKKGYHGILAKNLVRKTNSKTLIIPNQSKLSLKKILVPIDFSANSIRALNAAISINQQLKEKAEIICINVYEMPDISNYQIGRTWKQFKKIVEDNITIAFDSFINSYGKKNKKYIKKVLVLKQLSGIGKTIMDYANNNNIDFITMGVKGHSMVHLLLMGSVTEKLVSLNKTIPTLIIK